MIGFDESVEIYLDVNRFINDDETRSVAVVVAKHAENRRTAYRLTEKPGGRGMVRGKSYWSQTVPWYEWMSEPQLLQPCAEECGHKIWQLADVIAYQIRPSNWQSIVRELTDLKMAGHLVSVDDFGTGCSNLSSIKKLLLDFLKIDKSFVFDMEAHSLRSSLIPEIVSITHAAGARVIAEGIEN